MMVGGGDPRDGCINAVGKGLEKRKFTDKGYRTHLGDKRMRRLT